MSAINFVKQSNGSYVAETTVGSNFNLHVEFDEDSSENAPYAVEVAVKTAGSKYAVVAAAKGVVIDEDFDGVVYPKSLRLTTGRAVSSATVTEK